MDGPDRRCASPSPLPVYSWTTLLKYSNSRYCKKQIRMPIIILLHGTSEDGLSSLVSYAAVICLVTQRSSLVGRSVA